MVYFEALLLGCAQPRPFSKLVQFDVFKFDLPGSGTAQKWRCGHAWAFHEESVIASRDRVPNSFLLGRFLWAQRLPRGLATHQVNADAAVDQVIALEGRHGKRRKAALSAATVPCPAVTFFAIRGQGSQTRTRN